MFSKKFKLGILACSALISFSSALAEVSSNEDGIVNGSLFVYGPNKNGFMLTGYSPSDSTSGYSLIQAYRWWYHGGERIPLQYIAAKHIFQSGDVEIEQALQAKSISTDSLSASYFNSSDIMGSNILAKTLSVSSEASVKSLTISGNTTAKGNLLCNGELKARSLNIDTLSASYAKASDLTAIYINATDIYTRDLTAKGESTLDSVNINGNTYIKGNVGIGTTNPSAKLHVNGKILCSGEIEVKDLQANVINAKDINMEMHNAADYVFDENYQLQSLSEVESYVNKHKHLPGMPSATEMETNGVSVAKLSNLLLEKVEELTLHLIQLEKENAALKARVQELEK